MSAHNVLGSLAELACLAVFSMAVVVWAVGLAPA